MAVKNSIVINAVLLVKKEPGSMHQQIDVLTVSVSLKDCIWLKLEIILSWLEVSLFFKQFDKRNM